VGKIPVVGLVERGGRARAIMMKRLTSKNMREAILKHVDDSAWVMTDELPTYPSALRHTPLAKHHRTVNHSRREYVRGMASTNTVEGFFSLLQRGVVGTYHHVSEQHLDNYLNEFCFRYDRRTMTDGERAAEAIKAAEGKRLTLKQPRA